MSINDWAGYSAIAFGKSYLPSDSHTNTVIADRFAYSSRWRRYRGPFVHSSLFSLLTYSREQNYHKPKGISVTPFMVIIPILSFRIIFYSPEHEHPDDNISQPQNEKNKKNQPLSNRRHFPLLTLLYCDMLIMLIRDVMYIT